jgi:hypothetical protein
MARQGDKSFKMFMQHVKNLANWIPDISKRQIIIRIWNGSHQYLRDKQNEGGYDPEILELEDIEITEECFEIAENNKRFDQSNRGQQPIVHYSPN